jgi:hypothetical protein
VTEGKSRRPRWSEGSHLRWWLVAGAVVVLVVGAALITLAVSGNGDRSATDRAAIAGVVRDYKLAAASTYVVPEDLQDEIMGQRKALAEDGTAVHLGPAVMAQIDSSYEKALASLCSPAFAKRQLQWRAEHGLCSAATLERNLNREDLQPLLSEEFEVIEVQASGAAEDKTRAKVTMWIGDTSADGSRVESWAVYDYVMMRQDGSWKVHDEREVWHYSDADYEQWGPQSPHDEGESTAN